MHGGRCWDGDITGIAYREVKYHPISTFDVVASKKIIYLLPHRKEAYGYIFNI